MDLQRFSRLASGAATCSTTCIQHPSPPTMCVPLKRASMARMQAHKVEVEFKGETYNLEVEDGDSILDAALDKGVELPHDCRMGVCMTCPGKLLEGQVEQAGSMLSEDVADKGYVLLCVGQPTTDCKISIVPEDEVLELQLQAGNYS